MRANDANSVQVTYEQNRSYDERQWIIRDYFGL